MSNRWKLILILVLGLILRIILIPNPGFEADMSFWKSWGLATFDRGIVEGLKVSNNNYPTPFAYVLGLMVRIYAIFANPHNFNEFWTNTNLWFLTIAKTLPIIADFGVAGVLWWFYKYYKKINLKLPDNLILTLIGFFILNPLALADGAWWGQVDSVGVFVFLIAVILAINKKPFFAGLIFMLSMMTKLQNMIYGPLFFLFLWETNGYSGLIKGLSGSALAFFGLNIEFFFAREMGRVIDSLTINFDYFPWMSLNAYNLWWIVSGGAGMAMSDKFLALGLVNAKTVGLFLFSSFYLMAILLLIFKIKAKASAVNLNQSIFDFFTALILANSAFFFFQTESHDRYLFPSSVFLLLWIPFYLAARSDSAAEIKKSADRKAFFIVFYVFFSLMYFLNLHTALIINYPHNGFEFLNFLAAPPYTITISVLLLMLFAGYLFIAIRSGVTNLFAFIVSAIVFLALLSLANLKYLTKSPLSLTKITPITQSQGYGQLATNMTINSGFGTSSWNRLSVQYSFYRQGFGTHANSVVLFDINRKFSRLTFNYGIDTESGVKGSATFEVWGDNKLLWKSEKISRYDAAPGFAEVDIKNVKLLKLVTTDAGDGITDDHTDWLNPMLYP